MSQHTVSQCFMNLGQKVSAVTKPSLAERIKRPKFTFLTCFLSSGQAQHNMHNIYLALSTSYWINKIIAILGALGF